VNNYIAGKNAGPSKTVIVAGKLPAHTEGGGLAAEAPEGCPAAGPLPCLFVTTASKEKEKEETPPLPGPRKKQADALTENIKCLAKTFGNERIGFLTLTLGDFDAGGRYRNLRDRKQAQRRFHSLLTNVIARRYQCGATVTERHFNLGLHFHLVVVCRVDIRGQIDFAACFPPKGAHGQPIRKPDYSTANEAIKREWAFWRRTARLYGFGRHQLQPMQKEGEALGRYLGKYLSKDWEHRLPEDKGARCVRYFGHWSKTVRNKNERRTAPPNNSRFGWLTPRAKAWREQLKQLAFVLEYQGAPITEQNIKSILGPKWAWKMGKLFKAVRFEVGDWQTEAVRTAIEEHNLKVQMLWLSHGGNPAQACWRHVAEITLDILRPPHVLEKLNADWQRAKDQQWQMMAEVADAFQAEMKGGRQ
jgi:hypothetical protein